MEKIIVKINDARFATAKNLKLGTYYEVMYQDLNNFYIQDGGLIQEIPKKICEVISFNTKKRLYG